MSEDILQLPLKHFRANVARGASAVVRDGGKYGFGMIENVSVITRGEASGHDMWVDQDFMSDVAAAINASPTGIKARFTHPGLSSDGLGTYLGKLHDARYVGNQVIASLHFKEAATKTPDGDLADYVMTMAEESPEDFGLSIVFDVDVEAMSEHRSDNTQGGRFVSPDEDNKNNYDHARLSRLRAGDVVDSPAANPDGLFHRDQQIAADAENLLSYSLGLSDAKPELTCFDVDVDRVSAAVQRFLSRHNLQLSEKGEPSMTTETPVHEPDTKAQPTREEFAAELQRYITAFGQNGADWYAEGLSFSDCQQKHIDELQQQLAAKDEQIEELKEVIASVDLGEPDDVAGGTPLKEKKTLSKKIRIVGKTYEQN